MVTESHLQDITIDNEMVQRKNSFVLLEGPFDLAVPVVSQCHLGGDRLANRGDVIVTRESPANMGGDIHAAQEVKVGTFHLGPLLLLRVTTKPTVADLETQPPTNKLV